MGKPCFWLCEESFGGFFGVLARQVLFQFGMAVFHIAASDRTSLVRWLRNHVMFTMLLVATVMLMQRSTKFSTGQTRATVETQHASVFYAHQPRGWRKTANGWEHTSNWFSSQRPLSSLISEQRSREATWVGKGITWIQGISPLVFAMIQLAMIALIVKRRNIQESIFRMDSR